MRALQRSPCINLTSIYARILFVKPTFILTFWSWRFVRDPLVRELFVLEPFLREPFLRKPILSVNHYFIRERFLREPFLREPFLREPFLRVPEQIVVAHVGQPLTRRDIRV